MDNKEYIEAKDLDDFRNEIMDRFLFFCDYNDYNKLTLLRIGETIDEIYGKYVSKPLSVLTNADRIRAISDEELAKFMNLCGHDFPPYCDVESSISGECDQNCIKCAEKWLKQPAEV